MAEAPVPKNQIDAFTDKYAEGFEKFSNSKSGNIILDFVLFKKNLVPYTLQIVFVLAVLFCWIVAVQGILGQGVIGASCVEFTQKSDGSTVQSFNFIKAVGISVGLFIAAPFVIHYALELVKFIWRFLVHVYERVLVPLWNTLVLRFFANVMPQILPFLYERFMKAVDICLSKLDPLLDAAIGAFLAVFMNVAAVLKGVLWLPKKVCVFLGRWLDKSAEGPAK